MNDLPVYTSPSSFRSLWQEYRIFSDRLEFDTFLGKMIIPFNEIENFMISESEVRGLLHGDLHLKGFRPALKLDWANFMEHVVVDKNSGLIRRILFTPDDPEGFAAILGDLLSKFRKRNSG